MRDIQLKTVDLVQDGKKTPISYKNQLAAIMRTPTRDTADIEEIRKSVRILNELDKVEGDVLRLEDADFEYVCQRVKSARWPIIDAVILAFVEDVTS